MSEGGKEKEKFLQEMIEEWQERFGAVLLSVHFIYFENEEKGLTFSKSIFYELEEKK